MRGWSRRRRTTGSTVPFVGVLRVPLEHVVPVPVPGKGCSGLRPEPFRVLLGRAYEGAYLRINRLHRHPLWCIDTSLGRSLRLRVPYGQPAWMAVVEFGTMRIKIPACDQL